MANGQVYNECDDLSFHATYFKVTLKILIAVGLNPSSCYKLLTSPGHFLKVTQKVTAYFLHCNVTKFSKVSHPLPPKEFLIRNKSVDGQLIYLVVYLRIILVLLRVRSSR